MTLTASEIERERERVMVYDAVARYDDPADCPVHGGSAAPVRCACCGTEKPKHGPCPSCGFGWNAPAAANVLETARAASEANRRRWKECEDALYRLMLRLDNEEGPAIDDLRASDEWKAAAHVLGWDIDWEAMRRD